jgi:hypothetical protein
MTYSIETILYLKIPMEKIYNKYKNGVERFSDLRIFESLEILKEKH